MAPGGWFVCSSPSGSGHQCFLIHRKRVQCLALLIGGAEVGVGAQSWGWSWGRFSPSLGNYFLLLFFPFSQLTLKQKITCSAMDYGQELAKKNVGRAQGRGFLWWKLLGIIKEIVLQQTFHVIPGKKKKQCKLFVSLGTMRRSELIASVFNLHLPCDFHSGVSHWFWLAWLDSVPSYAAINQMSIFVRADEIIVVWAKREMQNHWAGGLKTQSNCPLSSCPSERGDRGMRGWELHRGAEDWWSHNLSFHSPQWAFG